MRVKTTAIAPLRNWLLLVENAIAHTSPLSVGMLNGVLVRYAVSGGGAYAVDMLKGCHQE
jgi:hypothetical protein